MKKLILISIIIVLVIIACKTAVANKNEIQLMLNSKSDSKVAGNANFSEKNGTVTFNAKINGLTPGEHAIHIHEKADCTAADGSSAGAHWNPTFKKHGKWGVAEYHKGDIGNFIADTNGNGNITFSTTEWCIGCEDETKNILNKGLIVHKGTDDFTSQPAGNAGARQACSAIIR